MGESPAGGAVGLSAITLVARSRRRPGRREIAAYAIKRHRHVIAEFSDSRHLRFYFLRGSSAGLT
jgi:hypothetical protein